MDLPVTKVIPFYPGQWGIQGSDSPLGVRTMPRANAYYVDWQVNPNANDLNDGTDPNFPLATLAAAYAKCTANQNDVVFIIGGPLAYNPTAPLVWDKAYTHIVGMSADLTVGQRVRIVNTAANDLATLFTVSANGCIIKNVQFTDEKDAAADGANVLVSGFRNYFENCFFAGMASTVGAAPATRAGSYSLRVSGAENRFVTCTVGLSTVIRTAANSELIVTGIRNRFEHCEIRSWSSTAGKFLVMIDPSATAMGDVIFENCLFYNFTVNFAAGITDAFNLVPGNTCFVVMRGHNQLVAVGTGWANNLGAMWSAGNAPVNTFGISLNPAA